jgi:hypothetical protein
MLDDCSAHSGSDFMALCREHSIILVCIAPHSSHVRQMLGVCLCGVMKLTSEEWMEHQFRMRRETACNVGIVFHCEFSKNRGPSMIQAFRPIDRSVNVYPHIHFRSIFLLEGGYSRLYRECPRLCAGGSFPKRDSGQAAEGQCHSALISNGLSSRSNATVRLRRDFFQTMEELKLA